MPTPQRRHSTGLIDQLFEDPYRFEFFQAVRLLERTLNAQHGPTADLLPSQLRFRNSSSLAFPSSEIESLKVRWKPTGNAADSPEIERIDITPAFMGLLGVAGALPHVYTEQIGQRELYQKDFAARSFLDLFSNRMLALFYKAWKKSRLQLQYETDRRNRFAPMVLALAGLGQTPLTDRLRPEAGGVDDEGLAFFAGTLQQRTLSASQLQRLLARYLKVPVRLEQFRGRWYALPPQARTVLGQSGGQLGRNALSGERVWQRDLCVRVVLGPLDHRMFLRFLPGAPGATALREILTLVSGVSLEYEISIVLRAEAVQSSSLGSDRSPLAGRLGWDTYLQTRPSPVDRSDVRYDIHAAVA
jgi:type VI secretion system protein ImpH